MPAVREAIVNGLTHADYRSGEAMQVDIFADSVEIYNAGWFPDGQTPEAHLSGEDKRSKSRNQLISSSLFKSKDIESYGTRMPRIKRLCDAEGIEVEHLKVPGGTRVVFHRKDPFVDTEMAEVPSTAHGDTNRRMYAGQLRPLHLGGHGRLSEAGIASRGAYPRARRRLGARGERGPDVQNRPAALGGQT